MALDRLPAVSGIDNFDWAGHEDSRAALFPGGQTAQFRKETWNAIVSRLAQALAAAGFSFDPAACRITESYGPLTAENFNRVVAAMTLPAPLAWAWENRADFPGYVGRREFEKGDAVYAIYLWELVRRLNLLLDILKNRAAFGEFAGTDSLSTAHLAGARARPAAGVQGSALAVSAAFAGLLARHIARLSGEETPRTRQEGTLKLPGAEKLRGQEVSRSVGRISLRRPGGSVLRGRFSGVGTSLAGLGSLPGVAFRACVPGQTRHAAGLAVFWLAPVWMGGLWLRQSRDARQENNTLEVI